MVGLLINIDVPDVEEGIAFYTGALGLTVGRRFDADFVELLGGESPLHLLRKDAGTPIDGQGTRGARSYQRHWSPIHIDFVVDDLDSTMARVEAAGGVREADARDAPYGRIALFADPFGHGLCLIQFNERGYDALL